MASGIRAENLELGLLQERGKRKNHKPDAREKLLAVPRYADLLDDMSNEDHTERGRVLVSTPDGWRTTMAKWVFDAQEAEREEWEAEHVDDSDSDEELRTPLLQPSVPSITRRSPPFTSTLAKLFGGLPKRARVSIRVVDEEAELMEALAEAEEDEIPDDGGIEIDSDEEYVG